MAENALYTHEHCLFVLWTEIDKESANMEKYIDPIVQTILYDIEPGMDECWTYACINNFKDMPVRSKKWPAIKLWLDFDLEKLPGFCQRCKYPQINTQSMAFLSVVKAPEIVRYYLSKGFLMVDNFIRKTTIILYKLRHRASQRINVWEESTKRNYINVIVIHPYHNQYRRYHATYKRVPRDISNIIRMIMYKLHSSLKVMLELSEGEFCICHRTEAPRPVSHEQRSVVLTNFQSPPRQNSPPPPARMPIKSCRSSALGCLGKSTPGFERNISLYVR